MCERPLCLYVRVRFLLCLIVFWCVLCVEVCVGVCVFVSVSVYVFVCVCLLVFGGTCVCRCLCALIESFVCV